MGKSRALKNIIFVLVILAICIVVFFAYYIITGKENPLLSVIENLTNNDKEVTDNYNGIYSYKESLNGTKSIFRGCSVTSINYYLLIVNEDFYYYKSSCMGTYNLGKGKVENLDIKLKDDKKNYVINYNDQEFEKDITVNYLEVNNSIANSLDKIDLDSYELILKETEFEGNYYKISSAIEGISSKMTFNFEVLDDGSYQMSITNENEDKENTLYKYNFNSYNNLPVFQPFGKSLIAIERQNKDHKYNYKFKAIGTKGIFYDLDKMFPIKVNNEVLDTNNSIYISYDRSKRYFRLFVGYDDKMCVENSESNKPVYYEFKITYDYKTDNFSTPEYVKTGYENEGCSYVNSYIGR